MVTKNMTVKLFGIIYPFSVIHLSVHPPIIPGSNFVSPLELVVAHTNTHTHITLAYYGSRILFVAEVAELFLC